MPDTEGCLVCGRMRWERRKRSGDRREGERERERTDLLIYIQTKG